ncbi:hypothetical protein TNCV_5104711 [Trichonephila clavipes]|nr:hypothetical protein TNCV_5104711 [Trichonephila clavipes]
MSSFLVLSDGDTRNRWRDGQVCPDVGQGTMAPWARRLGEGRRRKKKKTGEREKRKKERREEKKRSRGERSPPCMEKRAESGDWSEKDDERRWR